MVKLFAGNTAKFSRLVAVDADDNMDPFFPSFTPHYSCGFKRLACFGFIYDFFFHVPTIPMRAFSFWIIASESPKRFWYFLKGLAIMAGCHLSLLLIFTTFL
jgi:hypothetical protein